jgi:uncharacterized protein with WD repeat
MATDTGEWTVECSDEESYQASSSHRMINGKKVWEPSGQQIAFLYRQLEKSGSIDLKWQCPGRRSPSVHSNSQGSDKKLDTGENSKTVDEPNEFDFDEDILDQPSANKPLVPRRKSATTQATKKQVAKLDKVMNDMKKYQILDQQQRKSSTD